MAFTILPTENNVGATSGNPTAGKVITELRWNAMFSRSVFPHVVSGFLLPSSPAANLNFVVASGQANINGYWIVESVGPTIVLTANSFNRVYLQLTRDPDSMVNGAQYAVRTDTIVPADSLILAEVLSGASTQTAIDTRILANRGGYVAGTYRGTGAGSREVVLGFKPFFLSVRSANETFDCLNGHPSGGSLALQSHGFQAIGAGGGGANTSAEIYSYIAF